MSTIGQKLKKARKMKGMTQKEVAELTGIARATLANWEIGRAEPDLGSVKLLAEFYGVDANYILEIEKTEKSNRPNFDFAFQEKNLGDAIFRIINICAEFGLSKDVMFQMIDRAIEKYGLPGGDDISATNLDEERGVAAHGPDYPGSGILDGDETR